MAFHDHSVGPSALCTYCPSFWNALSFFFFQVSDYLFISVNPNTIHQHDFMHLESKYFLVKWEIM